MRVTWTVMILIKSLCEFHIQDHFMQNVLLNIFASFSVKAKNIRIQQNVREHFGIKLVSKITFFQF